MGNAYLSIFSALQILKLKSISFPKAEKLKHRLRINTSKFSSVYFVHRLNHIRVIMLYKMKIFDATLHENFELKLDFFIIKKSFKKFAVSKH